MIDGLGLYINEDLFATAGVTPPTTWTEVISIVPRLTVKNGSTIVTSAIALGTATNVEHFSDILALMFLQNGASLTTLKGKSRGNTGVFIKNLQIHIWRQKGIRCDSYPQTSRFGWQTLFTGV